MSSQSDDTYYRGHLLVATPALVDPNFARSVVLLVEHNHQGAMGLILNRPTSVPISKVWSQASSEPCHRNEPISLGGPCEGPLMSLHGDELASEVEVVEGVYFCAKPSNLEQIMGKEEGIARFFVGFSGWAAGQLEREMSEGSWVTIPADADHVFHGDDSLWAQVSRKISGDKLLDTLQIKKAPPDVSLN